MLEIEWGAQTDVGHRRQRNEDAYLARPPVFAVADGMGGHARGDLAAAMAVGALAHLIDHQAEGVSEEIRRAQVLDRVRYADRSIVAAGGEAGDAERAMGTTVCGLVASLTFHPTLLAFNVGDSRVYRFHRGSLIQISHDHSVVQELIDDGQLDDESARIHPDRNVVTRSLGSGDHLHIDWWTLPAVSGDRYLLCSDGLVKEVPEDLIEQTLARSEPAQTTADQLVKLALDSGGRDNVTTVVVDITGTPDTDHGDPTGADTNPRAATAPTLPRPSGDAETIVDVCPGAHDVGTAPHTGRDHPVAGDGTSTPPPAGGPPSSRISETMSTAAFIDVSDIPTEAHPAGEAHNRPDHTDGP